MSEIKTIDDLINYIQDRIKSAREKEYNIDYNSGRIAAYIDVSAECIELKANMEKQEICTCRRPISEYKHKYTCKCGQKWIRATKKDIQTIFGVKEKQNDRN